MNEGDNHKIVFSKKAAWLGLVAYITLVLIVMMFI